MGCTQLPPIADFLLSDLPLLLTTKHIITKGLFYPTHLRLSGEFLSRDKTCAKGEFFFAAILNNLNFS